METFKVGDKVRLKSGIGPSIMYIDEIDYQHRKPIKCKWYNAQEKFEHDYFSADQLEIYIPPPSRNRVGTPPGW